MARVSRDLYCAGCGCVLTERRRHRVRAYEHDTLYRERDVCLRCRVAIAREGQLVVTDGDEVLVLRPGPHLNGP